VKPLFYSFTRFIRQILDDNMLWAACLAPILAGVFFRFGIPYAETQLCGYFHQQSIMSDYYLLFDLFLSLITPYMICFASTMVMLAEADTNMSAYMAVTPVGRRGYIVSRLVFPAVISFIVSIPIMLVFTLTVWPAWLLLITCLLMSAMSVAVSLLIFSLSRNKVEGMAMAKMSGLFMLGLPVPFFLKSGVQYLFSPLPSFWMTKICLDNGLIFFLPAVITLLLWIWLLYRKFSLKLK
jgi:fluoroquinolone transport system permease protein